MTSRNDLIRTFAISACVVGTLAADPVAQSQVSLTRGAASTWNADWTGVTKRTYFVQYSLDMVNWSYGPVVEFGTGPKSWGADADNVLKFFIRLCYVDDTGVTTLQQARDADFDSDGIPNWFEVEEEGSDPLDKASAGGDSDSDGLPDGWERFHFGGLGIADPNAILQPDGLTNKEKAELGLNPNSNEMAAASTVSGTYGYDPVGRLTSYTSPAGIATYQPDEEGNLLESH